MENVPGRSIGYTSFGGGTVHSNVDTLPYRGTSAGGGYSTVEDLQRFASALLNHKLLNAEYSDLLTTGKVDTPRGGKYAFGFFDGGGGRGARHLRHRCGGPGTHRGVRNFSPSAHRSWLVFALVSPPAFSRF